MNELLSEVIPELNLSEDLSEFAKKCRVEEVRANKDRTVLTIVLSDFEDKNERLQVMLGREIKRQLFSEYNIDVNITIAVKPKKQESSDIKQVNGIDKPISSGFSQKNYKTKISAEAKNGLIYGRAFDDEFVDISTLDSPCAKVCIRGCIIEKSSKECNQGANFLYNLTVTDYTDTITVKVFVNADDKEKFEEYLKQASNKVIIKGDAEINLPYDRELNIGHVFGIKAYTGELNDGVVRVDTATDKRVELHCHTKMSDLDAIIDVGDLIKTVHSWGHKAVAITDHGVVQAFTDAMNAAKGLDDFKVIYGMEGYLVDDLRTTVIRPKDIPIDTEYTVFDIETTGLNAKNNKIIEIGAARIKDNKIIDTFQKFVNPECPIPFEIKKLTGIDDKDVKDADTIDVVLPEFLEYAKNTVLVAHNADFDISFISCACDNQNIEFEPSVVDTLGLSRSLLTDIKNHKLDTVAKKLNVNLLNHHRADQDAYCTAEILIALLQMAKAEGANNLSDLNNLNKEGLIKGNRPTHVIILVKNEQGRLNLYELVSKSHVNYFYKKPRIPKSELMKHREGLIIGTACAQGELYDSILLGKSDERLKEIANFYDYLEIQPISNNLYLTQGGHSRVNGVEELQEINKKIIAMGKELNKPVVAACDAHILNPEDEIYRRMLLYGQKYKDYDEPLPIYVRTTDEMLEEFSYLGKDLAYEVVVKNTNLIADMIEKISPVRPDKCPPVIEGSDTELRQICFERAGQIYGENLPEKVESRLAKELDSIISNGYAVMYIVARKLVTKSNEDGYLVGSRGSVGSSFVATMASITEVNPLPPHYYCPNCHYSDFDSDIVKQHAMGAGCDLPDMKCPVCSTELRKDGFDIPFETFLGFKGDKEPDIDLNFSGEYQSVAHKYTEEIFGKGNTYRAGTVQSLAEKTAFGYVRGYLQEKNITKRSKEIERISKHLQGVRRSTGQHPGGIVVVPRGEKITSFTPVQYPANDTASGIITTHFDYHSIEHNLLKLDILGHDDPSMIRMLEDLTGFPATKISLSDKKILSLFNSTEALGVTPDDIGCSVGTLGIPEFGTNFVMQMLLETKPKSFSDLVRISGLSHGTDVWTNNAQNLIKEGLAELSNAICTRDDIMLYLIEKGLEPSDAFTIMEQVRKGKGLKKEQKDNMLSHDVPQWYVKSCEKIKYMFPKAHAAAYVTMAYRIGYYKIYYPVAYYTAFFSIRAKTFDYASFCFGADRLDSKFKEYKRLETLTPKQKDDIKVMNIIREMYARGFGFAPIDIYKAKAKRFTITEENKIMPAFMAVEGLGETVAATIEKEAAIGKFTSVDNFRERTKADKNLCQQLVELGVLKDLPQSEQLSIFDFG